MGYVLIGSLRYNYLDSVCVVYNIETAQTLLLEKQAATILQAMSDKPISFSQIEEAVSVGDELDSDSLNTLLEHLVKAELVKKVA